MGHAETEHQFRFFNNGRWRLGIKSWMVTLVLQDTWLSYHSLGKTTNIIFVYIKYKLSVSNRRSINERMHHLWNDAKGMADEANGCLSLPKVAHLKIRWNHFGLNMSSVCIPLWAGVDPFSSCSLILLTPLSIKLCRCSKSPE